MTSASLPSEFLEMLAGMGLADAADAIEQTAPEVSVRLNRRKPEVSFPGARPVDWWKAGLTLAERPSFTLDPAFHQGRYYVQEAGSMFHAAVVKHLVGLMPEGRHLRVLDACAAPGGKTTAAIDALPDGTLVVANEIVPARAAVLRENLTKWGYPDSIITRGDTKAFRRLGEEFDIIIADVPCSGEGMMRKDADAVAQWSPRLVSECASLQREIIDNLWEALRPGGYLVYSTCTFNRTENELQLLAFMEDTGAENIAIPTDSYQGITSAIDAPGLNAARFIPGRTPTEGLFVAVLQKPGRNEEMITERKKGRQKASKQPSEASVVKAWVTDGEKRQLVKTDDRLTLLTEETALLATRLGKLTDVMAEGVTVATVKGRDIIPTQALAMSGILNRGAFPEYEVTREEAIEYLRGNPVTLADGVGRGHVLLTYENAPLGWVKNLGNRSNNLYPNPWRIKNK